MAHHHICGYFQEHVFDCECDFPQPLLTCENCEERAKRIEKEIEDEERDSDCREAAYFDEESNL